MSRSQACPPSARYRFRKFARRNKAAFLATATVSGSGECSWRLAVWSAAVSRKLIARTRQTQQARNVSRTIVHPAHRPGGARAGRRQRRPRRGAARRVPARPARLGVAFPQAAALRQPASHAAQHYGRPRGLQPGRPAACHGLHGWDDHNSGFADRPDRCTSWSSRRCLLGGALPRGMVYSPDGRYLAAARNDGKIRVWDPSSGQLLHTLEGHRGPAWQVAFSPDSRTLASGGSDRSVRLWDVTSGQATPGVFRASGGGQGRGVPSRWPVRGGGL